MTDQIVTLHYELDTEALAHIIEAASELNDNEQIFAKLVELTTIKTEIQDILDIVEKAEREAKDAIKTKAKTLYGNDWQAIKGNGYKISRVPTGSVYTLNPDVKVKKEFLEIKESVNTKAVELELEKTGKLPKGIEINPKRGESIRITVKLDENTET